MHPFFPTLGQPANPPGDGKPLTRDFFLTFNQEANKNDANARLYIISYMIIRFAVGFLGFMLPASLAIGEWKFIHGPFSLRGSLSAYYFTNMRDWFVGTMWVIGVLLMTYMAAQWKRFDFIASFIAGIFLIGVAMFPTERPDDIRNGTPLCGPHASPVPLGCAPAQQWLGELHCRDIHYVCAIIALCMLAAIAAVFGRREQRFPGNRPWLAWFHYGCAIFILSGLLVGGIGFIHDFKRFGFTPAYISELMAIIGFAAGWLVKSGALVSLLRNAPTTAA